MGYDSAILFVLGKKKLMYMKTIILFNLTLLHWCIRKLNL